MFIRFITPLCFVLIFGIGASLIGQEEDLAKLYREQNWVELEELVKEGLIVSPDWQAFLLAALEPEADLAVPRMFAAYRQSSNEQLRRIIRERISQYYAAQGYYETARRIVEDEPFFRSLAALKSDRRSSSAPPPPPNNRSAAYFGVQLGAFRLKSGAEKEKKRYQEKYPNAVVLEKSRGSERFYVVVVGGYASRNEAEQAKKELKNQLHIEGYIIQY